MCDVTRIAGGYEESGSVGLSGLAGCGCLAELLWSTGKVGERRGMWHGLCGGILLMKLLASPDREHDSTFPPTLGVSIDCAVAAPAYTWALEPDWEVS